MNGNLIVPYQVDYYNVGHTGRNLDLASLSLCFYA